MGVKVTDMKNRLNSNNIRYAAVNKLRWLMAAIMIVCAFGSGKAASFANEKLHYVIAYKWGLIHKDAGEATLTLSRHGANYNISLACRTKPWADKVFRVRDTLMATVRADRFLPLRYQKISHEGGKYGKDDITYSYSGNNVTGHCKRYRDKKGKISKSEKTLTAQGKVYDMLTIFYYLRLIDYDALAKGAAVKAYIFSGSKRETITVKNLGKTTIKMRNGTKREAYHIQFRFTSKGGKKSSPDMNTWISTDSRHIPLMLTGSLPIGQVRCYLE